MRVAAAAGAAQMRAKTVEKPFHAPKLNRCEPPRSAGKCGLPLVVSRAANDFDWLDREAREICRAGRRRSHAVRRPSREVASLADPQAGHHHQPPAVRGRCSDNWTLDIAGARRQNLSPLQPIVSIFAHEAKTVSIVRIPDPEKFPVTGFSRNE